MCAGTKSSQIGNYNFYYNKEEGDFHPCQNGQHGSPALSNENEVTKKRELVTISKRICLRLPLAPQDYNHCRVSILGVECRSRQGIQNLKDSREWKLNTQVFKKIYPVQCTPDIDLLAPRVYHQIP